MHQLLSLRNVLSHWPEQHNCHQAQPTHNNDVPSLSISSSRIKVCRLVCSACQASSSLVKNEIKTWEVRALSNPGCSFPFICLHSQSKAISWLDSAECLANFKRFKAEMRKKNVARGCKKLARIFDSYFSTFRFLVMSQLSSKKCEDEGNLFRWWADDKFMPSVEQCCGLRGGVEMESEESETLNPTRLTFFRL